MLEVTIAGVSWAVREVEGPAGGLRVLDLIQPAMQPPANLGMMPPQAQQIVQAMLGSQQPLAVIHVPFDRLVAADVGRQLAGGVQNGSPAA